MELEKACVEMLAVHGLSVSALVAIYLYARWAEDKKVTKRLAQIEDLLKMQKEPREEEEDPPAWLQ
jgi:hypothetical protein